MGPSERLLQALVLLSRGGLRPERQRRSQRYQIFSPRRATEVWLVEPLPLSWMQPQRGAKLQDEQKAMGFQSRRSFYWLRRLLTCP